MKTKTLLLDFLKRVKRSALVVRESNPYAIIKKNIYHTSYPKNALLSYLKSPFDIKNRSGIPTYHTNILTSILMAEALRDLGYNVDVINYDEKRYWKPFFNYNKYDLVTGMGYPLEHILQTRKDQNPQIVYFATGCSPFFSNSISYKRLSEKYNDTGKVFLSSIRYVTEDTPLLHHISDTCIVHGGAFAKRTFLEFSPSLNIKCIDAPVYANSKISLKEKDFSNAKKNYLWFGSKGAIHKGLDLLLDFFITRQDINLHICGNLKAESEFYDYYKGVLLNTTNIHFHSYVNIESSKFIFLMNECAFTIFPSCSEGGCPSVYTCMINGGLIPITTINTDVDSDHGITIEDFTVAAVEKAVLASQNMEASEVQKRSIQIMAEADKKNTFKNFYTNYKSIVTDAVK